MKSQGFEEFCKVQNSKTPELKLHEFDLSMLRSRLKQSIHYVSMLSLN